MILLKKKLISLLVGTTFLLNLFLPTFEASAAGYQVYVDHAPGSYDMDGRIAYRTAFNYTSYTATMKYWWGSWKSETFWPTEPSGHFTLPTWSYSNGDPTWHPLSDMNCHVYGGNWCNSRGGSDYTLRYSGRLYNYTGSTLYKTLPAGTRIHIDTDDGYTGGTSGRGLDVIEISGYYNSNGVYVDLEYSSGKYLDEPITGYYPRSYNINTY